METLISGAKLNNEWAYCSVTLDISNPTIAVNQSSKRVGRIFLNVGDKVSLSAAFYSNNPKVYFESGKNSFTWKTKSSKIATISSAGLLTAKNVGKTSINVSTSLSNGKNVSTDFNVIVDDIISQIYIWPNNVSMSNNSSYKLNIETEPTNANTNNLLWISSNPRVAMAYRNGYIRALSKGVCEITVYRKGKVVNKITVNVES